jgi:predicted DCC family thiol-disulfide oxidoreductase YuxK
MKWLTVLFDENCALCCHCRAWLMQQPAFVPLRFVPLQSPDISKLFPGIEMFRPSEQLIVVADDRSVYRGASAWVMCLWALQDYRDLAIRLANPLLLPLARVACELLSRNRFYLSDALFRQEPQNTARLLSEHYPRHRATWSNTCALS